MNDPYITTAPCDSTLGASMHFAYSPQPMPYNQQPMPYNQQPMPYNEQQPMPCNQQQPMPCNQQQPMPCNQQQPMMCNEQQPMPCNQQPVPCNQQPMPCNQQPVPCNQQPMPCNEQPMLCNQQPMLCNEQACNAQLVTPCAAQAIQCAPQQMGSVICTPQQESQCVSQDTCFSLDPERVVSGVRSPNSACIAAAHRLFDTLYTLYVTSSNLVYDTLSLDVSGPTFVLMLSRLSDSNVIWWLALTEVPGNMEPVSLAIDAHNAAYVLLSNSERTSLMLIKVDVSGQPVWRQQWSSEDFIRYQVIATHYHVVVMMQFTGTVEVNGVVWAGPSLLVCFDLAGDVNWVKKMSLHRAQAICVCGDSKEIEDDASDLSADMIWLASIALPEVGLPYEPHVQLTLLNMQASVVYEEQFYPGAGLLEVQDIQYNNDKVLVCGLRQCPQDMRTYAFLVEFTYSNDCAILVQDIRVKSSNTQLQVVDDAPTWYVKEINSPGVLYSQKQLVLSVNNELLYSTQQWLTINTLRAASLLNVGAFVGVLRVNAHKIATAAQSTAYPVYYQVVYS